MLELREASPLAVQPLIVALSPVNDPSPMHLHGKLVKLSGSYVSYFSRWKVGRGEVGDL